MTWWSWMILGAVLFGAEIVAIDAQFYLVFIGLSAALVGLLGLFGLELVQWMQWLIFAALSLVSMFTFRKTMYEKIHGYVPGFKDGVAGNHIVIRSELAPGAHSRESFRGSDWTVINEGESPIPAGSRVTIVRNEGLTLFVSADAT